MARKYHQNNFSTNVTSNQIAGVTTTPLNSIPSATAPFYIALDATNINGKYEVVEVTSKTATNILHAATTYAHTTAEEVRMVIPAEEMDAISEALSGGLGSGTDVHLDVRGRGNGLVKISVLRQNDTTNGYTPSSVILTGWGTMLGNGTVSTALETITFGLTFTSQPIIIIQPLGCWGGTGSGSNYLVSTNVLNGFALQMNSLSSTAATFYMQDTQGLATDAGKNYYYTWIAIGTI